MTEWELMALPLLLWFDSRSLALPKLAQQELAGSRSGVVCLPVEY